MTYVSNLIVWCMYMVDDSDKTVWWALHWVAHGKAGLRRAAQILGQREDREQRREV